MLKNYKVTMTGGLAAVQRVRAGITVPAVGGYIGELTKDQLEAIKADQFLTVSDDTTTGDESANQAEADQLVQDAREDAAHIKDEADDYAKRVRKEADDYAAQKRAEADKANEASKPKVESDQKSGQTSK